MYNLSPTHFPASQFVMKTLLEELVKSTLSKNDGWPNPQDSTGMELATLGKKRTCWEAVGPARTVFTTLQEQIADYIDQTSESLPRPVVWSLYMVGGSRQTARPTVTFISDDACSRKSLRRLLKLSGLLETYPGFLTMDVDRPPGCTGGVIGLQGGFDGSPSNESSSESARRLQVMVQTSPCGLMGAALCLPNRDRNPVATCGGVISSQGKLFLMSVAHAFEKSWNSTFVSTAMESEYTFDIDDFDDSDDSDEALMHPASEEGSGTTSSQASISAIEDENVGSINSIYCRRYTKKYGQSAGSPRFSLPLGRAALVQRRSFKQRTGYVGTDERNVETGLKTTDGQADSRGHVENLKWDQYKYEIDWQLGDMSDDLKDRFEEIRADIHQAEPKISGTEPRKRDHGKRHSRIGRRMLRYMKMETERERLAITDITGPEMEYNRREGSRHDLTVKRIVSLFLLYGPTVSSAGGTKPALDYCLFELPNELSPILGDRISNGPPTFTPGTRPVPRKPRSSDIIVCTSSGIVHGRLLATPSFMQSSNAGSQQLWTVMLQGSLQDGICGSWVLSRLEGEVYGHIVSGTPGGQLAYIVPFFEVVDDLKNRFGGDWTPKGSHAISGVRISSLSKLRQNSACRVKTWLVDRTTIGSSLTYTPLRLLHFEAEKAHYEAAFELLLADRGVQSHQENVKSQQFDFAVSGTFDYVARWSWESGKCVNQCLENSYCPQTPLSLAAMEGDEATVKMLLEQDDVEIDSRDKYGQTPLAWAAENGHRLVGHILLEHGANIDARDDYGRTPLSRAARAERNGVVRLLLYIYRPDVNSRDEYGATPLSRASEGDDEDIVELLLVHGAKVNSTDERGRTPLARAARNGNKAMVKILLEHGAEADPRDENGWTPLTNAAVGGREAIVKLLLDCKDVETDPKDKDGWTPLSLAAALGHDAVVRLLLGRKNVEVECRNMFGWAPLMLAAVHGHQAVVKLLLDHGAHPDCRLEPRRWPLLEASKTGGKAVALLRARADLTDLVPATPLSLAARYGQEVIVKLLLQGGAAVNVQDECGRTPLHYAVIGGCEEVVKLLLECGARADVEDLDPETALSLATRHGQEAIVKLLSERLAHVRGLAKRIAKHTM